MTGASSHTGAANVPHIPVMRDEVMDALAPKDGGIYVDGTFGAGGYSAALLASADCRVIGIDRDPTAFARAEQLAAQEPRFCARFGCFADMDQLVDQPVDGVALDIGVSSMQLDDPDRGFSLKADGPLDMRMAAGEGTDEPTAADLVNSLSRDELADALRLYGEERQAGRIAGAIVTARQAKPLSRTAELAQLIEKTIGRAPGAKIHPATRTFQALRILVNDELGQLARGLCAAEAILKPGGRLAVVSFHSLEDRLVKRFFAERTGQDQAPGSRHLPMAPKSGPAPTFALVFRGHRGPGDTEMAQNPRARSARLRAAERTAAAPWTAGFSADAGLRGAA